MIKKLSVLIGVGLMAFAGGPAHAQSYSNAVMALSPTAYWPLTETAQPPLPLNLTAKNLGSLGAVGTGYYGAWYQPSGATWFLTNNIVQSSAVTSPFDGSVGMLCQNSPGQYVIVPRNTNGVANAAVTLNPPFSIEAWLKIGTTASALGCIVSQGGDGVNLNFGGPNTNDPFYGGLGTGWAGVELGQYQDYLFFTCNSTNGQSKANELDTSAFNTFKGFKVGNWVHVVATFDGSKESIWTNGVLSASKTIAANGAGLKYVADPTTPLMIGAGSDVTAAYGQSYQGTIDDVAIYPTVLSQTSIQNHYQTAYGTNATYGSVYTNAVLADSPILYYRLNDPQTTTNAGYPSGTFPVANNYGSLGATGNGVYQPGTTPGVAGPPYAGFGSNSTAVAFNGWLGGVDVGNGNLPALLNPTSTVPLTVVSWFQTGPADAPGRFQEMVGHGDSSYRLSLGQVCGENHFNPGPGPELQFTTAADVASNNFAFNDGRWHMVAGVTDGTNEYMYLDGILAKSATTTNGIKIVGNTNDLLIGGDSEYTFASPNAPNTVRTFDGQVAQVAFWNSALSAAQIQGLYSAGGVPPYLLVQPQSLTNDAGNNITNTVVARGANPFAYQWYQNGSAVAGQTNASLIFAPATTGDAGNYYVVVSNLYGSATSSVVSLVLFGPPTVQEQSLTDIRVFAGQSPTLHVSAAGAQPISYQWNFNSSPISGATSSNYTIVNAQISGTYTCTLSNFVSTTSITPITLTVLADPTAPYPLAVLNDQPAAFWRLDETSGVTAYDYAGGNNAEYTNTQLGFTPGYGAQSGSDSDPAAEFGALASSNSYAGNVPSYVNFGTPNGNNGEFSVEAWINAYLFFNGNGIISLGYGNGGEEFLLDTGGTGNTLRFVVRNAAGTGYNANSTYSPVDDGLWHHVVGVCDEANGQIHLYLDGALAGSTTIPAGSGILSSTLPLTIGARQSANNNPVNYDYQFFGTISQAAVYHSALSAAQVQNHYLAVGIAPVITQIQPYNVITNQGANVTLTVTASGTGPLTYQWHDPNNNLLSTSNTLVLSDVQQNQSGNYSVTVTGPYGMASTNTSLTVFLGPPQITADLQPLNLTTYAGNEVTYTVTASGSLPMYFQWYKDGAPVGNATNSSYTFTASLGTNTYFVAVTNIYSYSQQGGPTYSSTGTVVGVTRPVLSPADYTYKLKVTFSGYTSNETLLNFPALVNLGTNVTGFAFSQFASPTGGDLRFTDATGTNEIPHEIDEWDDNGLSSVWVQVPSLAPSNTVIWAYWGNPAATTPLAWSTNGGVWVPPSFEGLPAYEVVYHLKESAFPFMDSTQNATATNGVAPTPTPGVVGHGEDFTGSSWLDAGTNDVGQDFTLSAWVNIPQVTSIQTIWANQHGGFGAPGFALWVNTYNNSDEILDLGTGDGAGNGGEDRSGSGAVSYGAWHLIEAAVNRTNGTANFYVDGASIPTGSPPVKDFTTLADLRLGIFTDLNFGMHGIMDEARIRQGNNSPNWVWADYMTVAQNSTFETYATVNSSAVTITYQVSGNNLILTWSQGTLQSSSQANGTYSSVAGAASPYSVLMTGPAQFYRVLVR